MKTELDDLLKIDMSWLRKEGLLTGLRYSHISWENNVMGSKSSIAIYISVMEASRFARLKYTQTDLCGNKNDFDYKIDIIATECNFGGERYWFICPLDGCGRKTRILYKNGDYFGCRYCQKLTYKSRNKNRRGKIFSLTHFIDLTQKIEELSEGVKKHHYQGKTTRKQKRINNLYRKISTPNMNI
uniref:Uncharacterized protein n=1 Tax=candidate division CPR3 bacterium TaxID=2268181 RepID=A0A7C4M2Z3_UNCC3